MGLPVGVQTCDTTDRGTLDTTEPMLAATEVEPNDPAVTNPVSGSTVAIDVFVDVQVARVDTSAVLPSE